MAKPAPIYPVENTVYDGINEFFDHQKRVNEKLQRTQLGLRPDEPMPGKPENMPFPKMVYKPEFYGTNDRFEQKDHYLQVDNQEELDEALSNGFFETAQDAKKEFFKQQDEKKKSAKAK